MNRKVSNEMRDLNAAELIRFAGAWNDLGWSVQGQVRDIIREGWGAEANPNAIRLAQEKLGGFNEELDIALEEWLDASTAREEEIDG